MFPVRGMLKSRPGMAIQHHDNGAGLVGNTQLLNVLVLVWLYCSCRLGLILGTCLKSNGG